MRERQAGKVRRLHYTQPLLASKNSNAWLRRSLAHTSSLCSSCLASLSFVFSSITWWCRVRITFGKIENWKLNYMKNTARDDKTIDYFPSPVFHADLLFCIHNSATISQFNFLFCFFILSNAFIRSFFSSVQLHFYFYFYLRTFFCSVVLPWALLHQRVFGLFTARRNVSCVTTPRWTRRGWLRLQHNTTQQDTTDHPIRRQRVPRFPWSSYRWGRRLGWRRLDSSRLSKSFLFHQWTCVRVRKKRRREE